MLPWSHHNKGEQIFPLGRVVIRQLVDDGGKCRCRSRSVQREDREHEKQALTTSGFIGVERIMGEISKLLIGETTSNPVNNSKEKASRLIYLGLSPEKMLINIVGE